ncbi:hypothetical protein B0T19DRAFT_404747 [Cercophora scortea]|uniref:Uncharacterized protein n=1 Tax=Cercophora scortea TaxID=314031 RepID=A0AAE0I8H6_9PEZI|nr:hypothetical protein B0T19DRAFT_404747 [Cercophora scortea]
MSLAPQTPLSLSLPLSLPLSLSLSQQSISPPTLLTTITNTSPSETYTLLTWSSPLDTLALQLGLVAITTPPDDTPFPTPKIMVKRAMPPPTTSLVTLAPGESASQEVVFREPIVDLEKLREVLDEAGEKTVGVQVRCGAAEEKKEEGEEEGDKGGVVVWVGKRKEELTSEQLKSLGRDGSAVWWRVKSEVLQFEV